MNFKRTFKKVKIFIWAILLLIPLNTYAQSHLHLDANLLVGFQHQKELNQNQLTNASHLGFNLGSNWQFRIYKRFYAELGIYGKFVHSRYETDMANFSAKVVRLQMPMLIGIKGLKKWQWSGGLTLENNRDFEDMNINLPFNLRYYATFKTSFRLHPKYLLSLTGNFNISNIPESFEIVNPENYLSVGVSYIMI